MTRVDLKSSPSGARHTGFFRPAGRDHSADGFAHPDGGALDQREDDVGDADRGGDGQGDLQRGRKRQSGSGHGLVHQQLGVHVEEVQRIADLAEPDRRPAGQPDPGGQRRACMGRR